MRLPGWMYCRLTCAAATFVAIAAVLFLAGCALIPVPDPQEDTGVTTPTNPPPVVVEPPPPAVPELQPIGRGKTVPFYIKTLYWWEDRATLAADLAACGKYRVGYGFEMMGDSAQKILLSDAKIAQVADAYKFAVAECRKRGIWLNVILVNDNMGKGKYGDPGIPLSKCMSGAKKLVAIVKAEGPANVIVTPVAETQTSAGRSYERYCAKELAGFILTYNGNGGHPKKKPSWAYCMIEHPCRLSDVYPSHYGVINDCGTAIIELQGGYDKPLNVAKTTAWFKDGAQRKYILQGAYAFKFRGHDEAGIKACSLAGETTALPDAPAGSILPSQVKWLGPNYSGAKVTRTLTSVRLDGNRLYFTLDKPLDWPKVGAKKCDGVGFLIRKIGDEYRGGKVEWCVSSRGWYDIKTNVKDGYNGSTMPAVGETVWCGIGHSTKTSECTTLVPVIWK